MSLFENDHYVWRETYFVLFDRRDRPAARDVERALRRLGPNYDVRDVQADEQGLLESLTLFSPDDYAAMDVTYVGGEEVSDQVGELADQIQSAGLVGGDSEKLARLRQCDARFDLYHFQEIVYDSPDGDDEEYLDPGALLVVLERLARLCRGIGVDPASSALM